MNVSLTPELEKYVQEKVETGRYTSASEVVREALRLLEQKDQDRERAVKAFQAQLDQGLAQADAGDLVDGEEVFAKIRQKSRLRRAKSA